MNLKKAAPNTPNYYLEIQMHMSEIHICSPENLDKEGL